MNDHSYLLNRAVTVFGTRPFTLPGLAIETKSRNEAVREAIDALVAAKQLEKVPGWPVTYRVVVNE